MGCFGIVTHSYIQHTVSFNELSQLVNLNEKDHKHGLQIFLAQTGQHKKFYNFTFVNMIESLRDIRKEKRFFFV